jgi:hypothetical protein
MLKRTVFMFYNIYRRKEGVEMEGIKSECYGRKEGEGGEACGCECHVAPVASQISWECVEERDGSLRFIRTCTFTSTQSSTAFVSNRVLEECSG